MTSRWFWRGCRWSSWWLRFHRNALALNCARDAVPTRFLGPTPAESGEHGPSSLPKKPHFGRLQWKSKNPQDRPLKRQRAGCAWRRHLAFGWAPGRLSRRIKQTGDLIRSFGACSRSDTHPRILFRKTRRTSFGIQALRNEPLLASSARAIEPATLFLDIHRQHHSPSPIPTPPNTTVAHLSSCIGHTLCAPRGRQPPRRSRYLRLASAVGLMSWVTLTTKVNRTRRRRRQPQNQAASLAAEGLVSCDCLARHDISRYDRMDLGARLT